MFRKFYDKQPPVVAGITHAKLVLFVFGALAFMTVSLFQPEVSLLKRIALLLWYPTIAGVAAASNAVDLTSFKPFCWRWWQRTVLIGAWLNLLIVIFTSDGMQNFSMVVQLSFDLLTSPYWFVVDGAIIGLVAGYTSNKAQKDAEKREN